MSVAVRVAPPPVAVIVTVVKVVTAAVVMLNVAVVAPAATVTLAGTAAALALLLASVTGSPPAGAALDSVTVPCTALPPLEGLSAIAETAGAACAVKRWRPRPACPL